MHFAGIGESFKLINI